MRQISRKIKFSRNFAIAYIIFWEAYTKAVARLPLRYLGGLVNKSWGWKVMSRLVSDIWFIVFSQKRKRCQLIFIGARFLFGCLLALTSQWLTSGFELQNVLEWQISKTTQLYPEALFDLWRQSHWANCNETTSFNDRSASSEVVTPTIGGSLEELAEESRRPKLRSLHSLSCSRHGVNIGVWPYTCSWLSMLTFLYANCRWRLRLTFEGFKHRLIIIIIIIIIMGIYSAPLYS